MIDGRRLLRRLTSRALVRPPDGRAGHSLIVICHPRPDSLTRAAADRVTTGLHTRGDEVRTIDLDAESFDPRLTSDERRQWFTGSLEACSPAHLSDLRWADRVILVHPTWYSGHPARLSGWFERVWTVAVGYSGEDGVAHPLDNIVSLEVVTTHGSMRWLNRVQAQSGLRLGSRVFRSTCHPACRFRVTALYDLDRQTPETIENWLEGVEQRYASAVW